MKDGVRAAERAEASRQELYEDYVKSHLQLCTRVGPCRDACLLKKAAQFLLRDPEPAGTFTVFPFSQAVLQGSAALSADYRKLLPALIKAAELLETVCVNLFLQPWKKEIKTLKTFTGPFVYGLLPVLSSSTIQSVLASIGYHPHTDAPQSEYRLREDANPERAMLVGFELLLARVECSHLLELLDNDQLGPREWLEVLHRRVGPTKLEEPTEQKTPIGPKEEEEEEEEKKREDAGRKEVPLSLDTRLPVDPQPKPRHCRPISVDQSIMEMQMIYPDLVFRGRPLLPDKRHSSSKAAHTAGDKHHSDDSTAAELPTADCIKGTKAAAAAAAAAAATSRSKKGGSRAEEALGNDRSSGGTAGAGDPISSSLRTRDGSRVDNELSGPQAISLHITLRAASTAEPSLKPGESQPTAEPPAWAQQQTAADLQEKRAANPEPPSLSSVDEERELRELAERMGQLRVQDSTAEERRGEGEAAMEAGPAPSHAAGRCTRSSRASHPPLLGGSPGQRGGGGEEEPLAHSFVIVHHDQK